MSIIYNLIYYTFKSLPPIYVQKGQQSLYPAILIEIGPKAVDKLHKDENNQAFLNNKSISEEELKEYIATLKNVVIVSMFNRLDLDNPMTASTLFRCPKFCGRYYKPNVKKENCKNETDPITMEDIADIQQFEIVTIAFEDNVKYCIPFSLWQEVFTNEDYQFTDWVPKPGETLLDNGDNGMSGKVKIYKVPLGEWNMFFVIDDDTLNQIMETKASGFHVKKVVDNVRIANYIYTRHPDEHFISTTRGGVPGVPLYIVYLDEKEADVYIEKIKKQLAGEVDLLSWINYYGGYNLKNDEELYALKGLDLEDRQLKTIPIEIGQLTNLKKLNFNENELKEIPKEIGKLTNLEELYISGNMLTTIPIEIGKLTNLKKLNILVNKLKEIPKELGQLTNLQKLDLRSNKLKEIPKEIGQLTNLKKLDISRNKLKEIPIEIGQLTNLSKLDLTKNQIKEIPEELDQFFIDIEDLDIDDIKMSKKLHDHIYVSEEQESEEE